MTAAELAQALKNADGGVILSCHVQPNASRTAVAGMYGTDLKIALKAPPVDGKANRELCRFLADLFGLSSSSAQLVAGQASRKKKVFLRGVTAERFLKEFAQ